MEIKREKYLNMLISRMHNGMIKVITGIRRCGKSYLLFHLFKNYLYENGVDETQIIELILDDDLYSAYRDPIKLGEYIRGKIADNKRQYYVFIDEIQYCKKIKNPDVEGDYITFYEVLNGLLRRDNVDVYVTGSNSTMLSKDVLTQFRGRGDEIHIYPLSFSEYFAAAEKSFDEAYADYEMYGGLPKLLSFDSDEKKNTYLKNLMSELYIKDIIQKNHIKNEEALNTLIDILASDIGSYTNPTNISNTYKSRLKDSYAPQSISNHIECIKDAYVIEEAKRYDIRGRKYIGANSKYYFTDIGLRNARLNFRQYEPNNIMENIIYNELRIRGFNVDVGIVQSRKQYEVDFVANLGSKRMYVQSAYEIGNEEKRQQEINSLKRIGDSFEKIIIVRQIVKKHYDDNGFLMMSLKEFLETPSACQRILPY